MKRGTWAVQKRSGNQSKWSASVRLKESFQKALQYKPKQIDTIFLNEC